MSQSLSSPNRYNHITQKFRIAGQHTLYLSVRDAQDPAKVFLRIKCPGCSSELIGLYDVIARLSSLSLQYGVPLEKVGYLPVGGKFAPLARCLGTMSSRPHRPALVGGILLPS